MGRVAKAVLIAAVPPLMVKNVKNPGGTPVEVFNGFRKALAENRAQFFLDVPSGPFYGFNRPGSQASPGTIQNWWRQGMMGSALAHYEGIKAFSETDQTENFKTITVPTLVMQGDDDQGPTTRQHPSRYPRFATWTALGAENLWPAPLGICMINSRDASGDAHERVRPYLSDFPSRPPGKRRPGSINLVE